MGERVKIWSFTLLLLAGMFLYSFRLSSLLSPQKKAIRYVPSPSYISVISGSYRPLIAELIFVKAVLDFTEIFSDKPQYLIKLCAASIHLDPKLKSAYFLGGMVFPQHKSDVPKGIHFLKEMLSYDPLNWRIPYWIGFNYYQLGEYLKTARYYQMAISLPGAPNFLKTNQAMLYYNAVRPDLGIVYFEGLLASIAEPRLLELVENKVRWLKDILFLEEKVQHFKVLFGRFPENLDELVEKQLITQVPEDTFGRGFYLDTDLYRKGFQFGVRSKF